MIDRSQTKSIPGPRLKRMFLSPSAPNAERMVCESCSHVAPAYGGPVVHSTDCPWDIEQKAKRAATK
jgi:hypothetical protein